jgi:predicted nucleic acid-binding protein
VAEAFFDTNVLLYLLSGNVEKADQAEDVIAGGGTISVQVLNEFAAVASRKLKMEWSDIREALGQIQAVCKVVPLTVATHDLALAIAERYQLGIYDASIVAAALESGCKTLYSEDLQDGQVFKSTLKVRNPFRR